MFIVQDIRRLAFIGCGNYPECRYTRPLSAPGDGEAAALDGKVLGHDEGQPVTLRIGRFGPMVQIGTVDDEDKPKFASLQPGRALALVAPHDPLPLLARIREAHGDAIEVSYLQRGPEAWTLKLARA
mgnify:CR=1 FL=1